MRAIDAWYQSYMDSVKGEPADVYGPFVAGAQKAAVSMRLRVMEKAREVVKDNDTLNKLLTAIGELPDFPVEQQ